MKKYKVLIVLLFIGSMTVFSQEKINWMSMDEALALQSKNPKKIIMDVYTTWCGPCKLLDKNTFGNTDVIKFINKNYYAVKFNAEGTSEITYNGKLYDNPDYQEGRKGKNSQHYFTRALKIKGYPTIVFFNNDGGFIQNVVGYKTPDKLEIYLKMMANDDYLTLTTTEAWQEYQNNFKGTFD